MRCNIINCGCNYTYYNSKVRGKIGAECPHCFHALDRHGGAETQEEVDKRLRREAIKEAHKLYKMDELESAKLREEEYKQNQTKYFEQREKDKYDFEMWRKFGY